SCPPPRHNFTELPRIRSERPAFELHYPHLVDKFREEAHVGQQSSPYEKVAAGTQGETKPGGDEKAR
ncbi:MAG TPA: cytochrome ubiquinol oxidase subunit I, partial [Pseudonocardia sp.]